MFRIKDTLVPDAESINAKLLKLNIYGKGGHFKKHKDTPRGDNFFGSLVLFLPVQHSGGKLKLSGPTVGFEEVVISSNSLIKRDYKCTQIGWAAFFGDVDHTVEKIYGLF